MSRSSTSAKRQGALNAGASSATLAIATGAQPIAPARLVDDEMGDSASDVALSRLNDAVTQLKAMTVAPLLQKAVAALGDENPKLAAELALKALGHDEKSGLGWYLLAIAREKSGDFLELDQLLRDRRWRCCPTMPTSPTTWAGWPSG